MRICPTCAGQVATTLHYCPRCSTLLPEPRYRPAPGYYAEPGHYADPRYYAEPGHYADPADGAEPGHPPPPGYPAELRYSGPYLPAPYADAPDQPGQHEAAPYRPGQYEAAPYRPDQYEAAPCRPDQYEAAPYQPDRYEASPYQPGQYETAPYGPGPGDRVRGELDRYPEAPYEDDPGSSDPFGDRFAGGAPETAVSPARPAPVPVADGEWEDTASRLLYPPPGPPRRDRWTVAGHRAQIISAALAAVALLAGLVTARAAFGGHRGAAPGARLAGRQTAATRQASPPPRRPAAPSPSPAAPGSSPSVPAPSGGAAVVTMAPGLSQAPDAAQVDGFLVSYFTAINTRDYQSYARLLIPAQRAQLSAAAFARGYRTTTDTGASIVGISTTGGGVAATVTFTSEQRAAPGADVTGCTYWDITLYLRLQGGALLIGNPPAGYHAYHRSCL